MNFLFYLKCEFADQNKQKMCSMKKLKLIFVENRPISLNILLNSSLKTRKTALEDHFDWKLKDLWILCDTEILERSSKIDKKNWKNILIGSGIDWNVIEQPINGLRMAKTKKKPGKNWICMTQMMKDRRNLKL